MIIHLISSPRTISTALMYAFAQREQIQILDEPFYGVYLKNYHVDHPGKAHILFELPTRQEDVHAQITQRSSNGSILFMKNMASHFKVLDLKPFYRFRNVFLIRNPKQIIQSFAKVIEKPTLQDIGVKWQKELFKQLNKHSENPPIVLDSNAILDHPEAMLAKFCAAVDIPFDNNMLSWPAGPKVFDGSWAPYWYKSVHETTGFDKGKRHALPDISLSASLEGLYKEALPYYNYLYQRALKYHPNASTV